MPQACSEIEPPQRPTCDVSSFQDVSPEPRPGHMVTVCLMNREVFLFGEAECAWGCTGILHEKQQDQEYEEPHERRGERSV